jgi:enoyl-CoA hydratase/carnithine racemase
MNLRHLRHAAEGGIVTLTLARPPVNALGRELVEDLAAACEALAGDRDVRALVLAAEGRNFCAGADLKERQGMSEDDVRRWVQFLNGTFEALANLPFPTVAAIQGVAAGGGFELALACDFRVLEESGQVGLPESTLAILPGAGGTQRLPRLIGPARAKRWIFDGSLRRATEALVEGAVDQLADDAGAIESARALVGGMMRAAPLSLRHAKRAIDEGWGRPLHEALQTEIRAYEAIIPTEDRREALAAFREKRPPVWKGR